METNVPTRKQEVKKKMRMENKKKTLYTNAGQRRAEKRFVDRIIRKIFQLAKANKNQACYFHTLNMDTPSQWLHAAFVPSSILN